MYKKVAFLFFLSVFLINPGCGNKPGLKPPAQPGVVPQAPANLSVYPGNKQIKITWSASDGATYYRIYFYNYGTTISGNRQFLSQTTSTTYTDDTNGGLKNGVLYKYYVYAFNNTGTSKYADTMGIPASVTASASIGGITLTWTAVTKPTAATSYTVFYNSGSGIKQTTSASSATVSGLTPSTYTFTVTAAIKNFPPGIPVGAPVTATVP